jgi:hypothetical protein
MPASESVTIDWVALSGSFQHFGLSSFLTVVLTAFFAYHRLHSSPKSDRVGHALDQICRFHDPIATIDGLRLMAAQLHGDVPADPVPVEVPDRGPEEIVEEPVGNDLPLRTRAKGLRISQTN